MAHSKPLAGRSPLGVSHWLPHWSFAQEPWQSYFRLPGLFAQPTLLWSAIRCPSSYRRTVRIVHEMASHDAHVSCETFCKPRTGDDSFLLVPFSVAYLQHILRLSIHSAPFVSLPILLSCLLFCPPTHSILSVPIGSSSRGGLVVSHWLPHWSFAQEPRQSYFRLPGLFAQPTLLWSAIRCPSSYRRTVRIVHEKLAYKFPS
jgi:hypothetical protein